MHAMLLATFRLRNLRLLAFLRSLAEILLLGTHRLEDVHVGLSRAQVESVCL